MFKYCFKFKFFLCYEFQIYICDIKMSLQYLLYFNSKYIVRCLYINVWVFSCGKGIFFFIFIEKNFVNDIYKYF